MIRMLLFAVLLAACATIPDAAPSFGPTVYVQNATDRALEIHAAGLRIGSVPSGGSRCMTIGARNESLALVAVARTGETVAESLAFSPLQTPNGGWYWRVGRTSPIDRIALAPYAPCR